MFPKLFLFKILRLGFFCLLVLRLLTRLPRTSSFIAGINPLYKGGLISESFQNLKFKTYHTKCQKISKAHYLVLIWSKKWTKYLSHSARTSMGQNENLRTSWFAFEIFWPLVPLQICTLFTCKNFWNGRKIQLQNF